MGAFLGTSKGNLLGELDCFIVRVDEEIVGGRGVKLSDEVVTGLDDGPDDMGSKNGTFVATICTSNGLPVLGLQDGCDDTSSKGLILGLLDSDGLLDGILLDNTDVGVSDGLDDGLDEVGSKKGTFVVDIVGSDGLSVLGLQDGCDDTSSEGQVLGLLDSDGLMDEEIWLGIIDVATEGCPDGSNVTTCEGLALGLLNSDGLLDEILLGNADLAIGVDVGSGVAIEGCPVLGLHEGRSESSSVMVGKLEG